MQEMRPILTAQIAGWRARERIVTSIETVTVYAFIALTLTAPLIADLPVGLIAFLVIWLGGSCLAGAVVPRRWMLAIPATAFLVLLAVLMLGVSDSELLTDPLSIIAVWVLTMGEVGGLLLGFAIASNRRHGEP